MINTALQNIGLIHQPLSILLFSKFAVLIVVTYLSIPVSTLILVGAMQNVDRGLLENARDLGAGGLRAVIISARPAHHDRDRCQPGLRIRGHLRVTTSPRSWSAGRPAR